ncbi:MAG: hypothetical protein EA396_09275, partial [Anaerolineaceae bacterium]
MYDINIAQNTESLPSGKALLAELYKEAPAKLYFEIRCIHPTSAQVRSLWARMDDADGKKRIFAEAERLNKEGYGLYFAPCVRREKKGSAASAALVPALWVDVDCDSDQNKRDKGLAKLQEFDPAPSVIVDSGGGWHAYWLLDAPFTLETDDDKQRIAHILHGLFKVLDGDEAYVKSVASVMRLPDSINTKPNREGAMVGVVDWHPDRRYALNSFDWLAIKPQSNGYTPMF